MNVVSEVSQVSGPCRRRTLWPAQVRMDPLKRCAEPPAGYTTSRRMLAGRFGAGRYHALRHDAAVIAPSRVEGPAPVSEIPARGLAMRRGNADTRRSVVRARVTVGALGHLCGSGLKPVSCLAKHGGLVRSYCCAESPGTRLGLRPLLMAPIAGVAPGHRHYLFVAAAPTFHGWPCVDPGPGRYSG